MLYYNNAQGDGDWGNLLNWWQDDAFSVQATALPTTSDVVNLYSEVTQNTQGADQCFCADASFWSADFGAGLTLHSSGVVNMQGSSILAGTTADGVSMHDSSTIAATGVVNGNAVLRDGSTNAGTINGTAVVYYDGGTGHFPIGGSVTGSVTYQDFPEGLYYTNASGDSTWETLTNWQYLDLSNPTNIPWTDDGNGGAWYGDSNLIAATGGLQVFVNYTTLDPNMVVTGSCDLDIYFWQFSNTLVYGGTYTNTFDNEGLIYGGTFTAGGSFNGDTIYGGTFTGPNLYSEGDVFGGNFYGDGFTNTYRVLGGNFFGTGFANVGSPSFVLGGNININGFVNSQYIDYSNITINLDGVPYTGVWQGQIWSDGVWVSAAPLYYTNASGDSTWENLLNWNFAADGSGDNPTNIPWTDDGNGGAWYGDSNLIDATGGAGIGISSDIDLNAVVTGICDIYHITSNGNVYGGNFSGWFYSSYGSVYGGSFSGVDFSNFGFIYGGTFSGDYAANSSPCTIYGGYFTGNNFGNFGGFIYGGIFSGNNFQNHVGYCSGIIFSGNGFYNDYGSQVVNCDFTLGAGFSDWSVQGCTFGSDGTFVQNGQNYTHTGEFAAITYPASGSGGGNSLIARLLNLPAFIKI